MNKAQSIAEKIETEEYALLLPDKAETLRQYLGNDGILSNEEITSALYDDKLTKKGLREKIAETGVTDDPKLLNRLTSHLWETHRSVQAARHLLPTEGIDPNATYRLTISEGQTQGVASAEQNQEGPGMPKVVVVPGNLMANFLHNFRLNRNLQLSDVSLTVDKLPTQAVKQNRVNRQVGPSKTDATSVKAKTEVTPPAQRHAEPKGNGKASVEFQWNQVESQMAAAGLTREQLTNAGQLSRLLNGQQTAPLTIDQKIEGRYVSLTGKLRMVEVNGQPTLWFQPIRDEKIIRALTMPKEVQGYVFSTNDRANFIKNGELGKVVELTDPRTRQPYRAFVGTDRQTQQLVVTRQEQVKLPKTINGVPLTQTQREMIGEGKAVRLDGLTAGNGQVFSAYVQVSAAKRGLNVTNVPADAVKQTTDLKTAADLKRPSQKLHGTPSGQSRSTEAAKPKQTSSAKPARPQEPAFADDVRQGPRIR